MKRTAGYLLVAIGAAFLVSAPFLRFYDVPRLEKTPMDEYFVSVATGVGNYLDPGTLKFKQQDEVTVRRTSKGDPTTSSSKYATWNVFQRTTGSKGNEINLTNERWRFDRHTGQSAPTASEDPQHQGVWLRFPFNAEKKTYQFWDATAHKAFPAAFVGETKLRGHTVYEYKSVVEPTRIETLQAPGDLVGQPDLPYMLVDVMYSNPESIVYVDPRTGVIVNGSSHRVETLRAVGSSEDIVTILDVTLKPTDATVTGLLKKASDGRRSLGLVGTWIPLGCLLLGLISLIAAARLFRPAISAMAPPVIALPDVVVPAQPTKPRETLSRSEVPGPRSAVEIEPAEPAGARPTTRRPRSGGEHH
jgi:hypothetical protein